MSAVAMVAALGALAVSLSGIAGAASKHVFLVKRGDIAPGAVTAKSLAPGSVHAKALAASAVTSPKLRTGSVNRRVLKKGSVTPNAIAPDAVTAGAIAPGSVYGGALAERTLHVTSIKDLDQVAENGTWTGGDTGTSVCGTGEVLLGTGFAMPQPGNGEVAWIEVLPFLASTGQGVKGRYVSNSGGSAEGQVVALCLK
ncbi:MAG: hypothetical protein ACTHN3_14170 [Solirubrobacterales bacterium]